MVNQFLVILTTCSLMALLILLYEISIKNEKIKFLSEYKKNYLDLLEEYSNYNKDNLKFLSDLKQSNLKISKLENELAEMILTEIPSEYWEKLKTYINRHSDIKNNDLGIIEQIFEERQ